MAGQNRISAGHEAELVKGLTGPALQQARAAVASGDWIGFFRLLPKSERLIAFTTLKGYLDHNDYYRTLGWVWVNGEKFHLQQFTIRELLNERPLAARRSLMERDELAVFDSLAGRLNVFRGQEDEESLHGWSWSLDKETAKKFTYGDGFIRSGTCNAENVIAFKHGPEGEAVREDELIIDPDNVGPLDEEYHAPNAPPEGLISLKGIPVPGFGQDDLPLTPEG